MYYSKLIPLLVVVHQNYSLTNLLLFTVCKRWFVWEFVDDPTSPCERIDVLVGSDFYWDFVSSDTRAGSDHYQEQSGMVIMRCDWIDSCCKLGFFSLDYCRKSGWFYWPSKRWSVNFCSQTLLGNRISWYQPWWIRSIPWSLLCDIEYVQGHYQVGLLWKRDTTNVHNHFNLVSNCCNHVCSRSQSC